MSSTKNYSDFFNKLYEQTVKRGQIAENNFVLGIGSVYSALALVLSAARSSTKRELLSSMKLDTLGDPHEELSVLLRKMLNDTGEAKCDSANRVYVDEKLPILESYLTTVKTLFDADAKSVDFAEKPDASREEINEWVEKLTKHKIKNLLPVGSISESTTAILVNAMYFKGAWKEMFDKTSTSLSAFSLFGGREIQVPFMYRTSKVDYHETDTYSAIRIPFNKSNLTFGIILPQSRDGLKDLLAKGLDFSLFKHADFFTGEVEIHLPKFKISGETELKDVLNKLGIVEVFSCECDLSGLSSEKLMLSEGYHKAFIEVDEDGAEAAAATAFEVCYCSMQINPIFAANHPFLFAILSADKEPIFAGHVTRPEY